MTSYHDHGVRFEYPDGWDLEEERFGTETHIGVSGEGSSFWSLVLFDDRPDPETVLDTALGAFRDEYEELDEYDVAESGTPGEEIAARDLQFVCMELVSSAFLRAFRGPFATGLVLYQGEDRELEETGELLDGITQSLDWDD